MAPRTSKQNKPATAKTNHNSEEAEMNEEAIAQAAATPEEPKTPEAPETPEATKTTDETNPEEGENREGNKNMSITQALEVASRLGKVRRDGWPKELSGHYVVILRGETRPTLTNGKHSRPYQPSIVDVMADDWYEIID